MADFFAQHSFCNHFGNYAAGCWETLHRFAAVPAILDRHFIRHAELCGVGHPCADCGAVWARLLVAMPWALITESPAARFAFTVELRNLFRMHEGKKAQSVARVAARYAPDYPELLAGANLQPLFAAMRRAVEGLTASPVAV